MRKVGWTKRFAAGWGERRPGNGRGSSRNDRFLRSGRLVRGKSTLYARSISEAAPSFS